MLYKDHYQILELEPSASLMEIKKAYRRLAHHYHPDKNPGDLYAAAQFAAIKDAYEILSNPGKKEIYLQQRWYNQSIGKKKTQGIATPVTLLKQILELDKYVSRLDIHRMDKTGLYDYLQSILTEDNLLILQSFGDKTINKEVIVFSMRISRFLTPKHVTAITEKLLQLTDDQNLINQVFQFRARMHRAEKWELYKPVILLLIVIFVCLVMVLVSR